MAIKNIERDGTPYIGDWLRAKRKEIGYTQQELANKLNIKRTKVVDLELERQRPKRTQLANLITFFENNK